MKPTDIYRLRARIAALQAEHEALALTGPNAAERADLVASYCQRAGASAHAGLAFAIATGDLGPALMLRANQAGVADAGPLFAAILGADALAAALCKYITPDDGPDAATRAARMVAIDAELDRLEREEEAAVVRSELAGTPIARRADARPEIVLEVVS